MITRRFLPFVVLMAVAIAVVAVTDASATTLNLDTGKSLSVAPGATGTFTFSLTNDAGDVSGYGAWSMWLQVVPSGATTGSVLPDASGLALPTVNPLPTTASQITQPTANPQTFDGGVVENGSTEYWPIGIQGSGPEAVLSSTSYNIGTLSLSASADAVGTWNVYAVQQSVPRTFWLAAASFPPSQTPFGNLPLAASGQTSSVLLGSVTVVPEPSTAGMLVVALGAAGVVVRNRRSRKTIEPAKGDVLGECGSRCIGA